MMQGQITIADTYIDAGQPDNNNGEEGVIYIGRNVSTGSTLAGMFAWPMPIIDADFTAMLTIVPAYKALQHGPCSIQVFADRAGIFDELQATWENRGDNSFSTGTGPILIDGPDDQPINIDVTQQVWAAFGAGLSHIVLIALPATDINACVAFHSKDSGTHPEWGPRLRMLHG